MAGPLARLASRWHDDLFRLGVHQPRFEHATQVTDNRATHRGITSPQLTSMPLEQFDPVEAGIIGVTLLLSVSACVYLAGVAWKRPILTYEPRRPVPWNVVAIVPVALYMVSTIAAVWSQLTSTGPPPPPHTDDIVYNLAAVILQQLLLFGGLFVAVVIAFHANPRDIGLPTSARQFVKDIAIGVVAGIAALGPVHVIQAILAHLMEPGQESQHPLVKMVQEGGADTLVLILASIAAVVVAPICEELVFRLLLQGWLEKREDARLGWRSSRSYRVDSRPKFG